MVDFYEDLIEKENCEAEIILANDPKAILNYTQDILVCDIHTRFETKEILKSASSWKIIWMDEIMTASVDWSGYNSKYPYLSSTTTSDYGNNNFDLSGTNYDWGVYNAIYNPKTQTTDAPGTWRTLTASEWDYVINSRSGISFALAKVNGVPGFIIVPDGWSSSIYTLNNTNRATVSFSANVITLAQWTTLENAGCVFLPAAGIRDGYSPTNVGSDGYYWSATSHSGDGAYYMSFSGWIEGNYWFYRYHALSVRLVRTVQ